MFTIQNNEIYCEEISLTEIATAAGTPVYIYSQAELLNRVQAYLTAVPAPSSLVAFALKANNNPALLRLLAEQGVGADVTSAGELFLAQHAGISPDKIIFSGVGKRRDEIEAALDCGVRALHIESEMELHLLAEIVSERQTVADIGIRVNPDIPAETHPYMSTGQKAHKFGVSAETALSLLHFAQEHPHLNPVGLAAHIGSQITAVAPFKQTADYLVNMAQEMESHGIRLTYIDVGGGWGVDYSHWPLPRKEPDAINPEADNPPISQSPNLPITQLPNYPITQLPNLSEYLTAVSHPVNNAGYNLALEPGRSLIASAGILLTQVVYTKMQAETQFVIVDAGMSDLIRPTLYDAYHPVHPVKQPDETEKTSAVTVAGPICETGDWLAKERQLPPLSPGDYLAIGYAGAYGYAMSSNYNGRLRPAEVLVNGSRFAVIRRRQDVTHLLDGCQAPE